MMQKRLRDKLAELADGSFRAVIGLDGFVDEVVHVVDKRYSATEYKRVRTLKAYGERIAASSGLSTNVEIVTVAKKLGGNGPIFALGLKKFNAEIVYIGCTGENGIDSVFSELSQGSRIVSVCAPGQTDAMEFEDGKLIRSKLESLNTLTWDAMLTQISKCDFAALLDEAVLISFNNWTMLPHMSDIWKHILSDILPLMKTNRTEKILFFDLADPQKRKMEDVEQAIDLIRSFKKQGFQTVLGLNKKEACEIAEITGKRPCHPGQIELHELTEYVAAQLGIDCVAVHPTDSAACVRAGRYFEVKGPYCSSPILTTGAGDNFNAGFAWGYVMGLDMECCLTMGVATSGFYVRKGRSPNRQELFEFLNAWEQNRLDA